MGVGGGTDPAAWGIEAGYRDVAGVWHDADPAAVASALEAMGARPGADPGSPPQADVWVVRAGHPVNVDGGWVLRLEEGTEHAGHGSLPESLPLGYHDLQREGGGGPVRVIVTPPSCHLPAGLRTWGWAAQLYAMRSESSWGMGDLADLAALGRWSRSLGAGVALVNPIHAVAPGIPQEPSPYYPSSRSFRNPLYVRVEDVPGASAVPEVGEAAVAGRALNAGALVDRDAVWGLKSAALEAVWRASGAREGRDAGFARFGAQRGTALERFAAFCAITEVHGRAWPAWPAELRRPDSPAVAAFVAGHSERVRFHAWLQWLVDEQLARAGGSVGLVTDLAIGADPNGADAWMWQDSIASGVRVGAPPDEFNLAGQDWGFPPFDPWRLRTARFDPFVEVVRAALAHAAGIRIDHVAGLFRLYWIPPGCESAGGLYVRYPWEELLSILALESVRAGAWVVGEDLGTVEPRVREELARRDILSTRVMWFEDDPPARYPERAAAVVTTHDLPTIAGVWTGADAEDQQACGVEPDPGATAALKQRLRDQTGLPDDAPVEEVIVATYARLAEAPSAVVLAGLEDALAVPWRPNLPGTVSERPNWARALPRPLEALVEDPLALAVAEKLGTSRPRAAPGPGHGGAGSPPSRWAPG
jgi:4-alpha-glucanotransferase